MYPTKEQALRELDVAGQMNPGPWTAHSENVALAARLIAEGCGDMDADRAEVIGLLHDIGRRTGIAQMRHAIDGYNYCMEQGWNDVARICLTHSFPIQDINADIGKQDIIPEQACFIQHYLKHTEYDDYDRLIILCDCLATADGLCILEKRFVDTTRRYGVFPFTIARWNKTLEFKAYFETKVGRPLYALLPGIEQCIYQ